MTTIKHRGRVAAAVLVILTALGCRANINQWYEPPRQLPAGSTAAGAIAATPAEALVHVRAAGGGWSVTLAAPDGSESTEIRLDIDRNDHDLYPPKATITVSREADGMLKEKNVYEYTNGFNFYDGYNSIVYRYDGVASRLTAGESEGIEVCRIPVPTQGCEVWIDADRPTGCRRLTIESRAANTPVANERWQTPAEVEAWIENALDPGAAVWEYLDRDADAKLASVDTSLRLATIPDGRGGYLLLCVGCSGTGAYDRTMHTVGRLRPTIFKNEYDMEWIPADGNTLTDDLSAALSDDMAILTLRFPLLKTVLRMRRV